jgi:hypothetical protein
MPRRPIACRSPGRCQPACRRPVRSRARWDLRHKDFRNCLDGPDKQERRELWRLRRRLRLRLRIRHRLRSSLRLPVQAVPRRLVGDAEAAVAVVGEVAEADGEER